MTKNKKSVGVEVKVESSVIVIDESIEAQNTLLMVGLHNNHADFKFEGVTGQLLFMGDELILELNKFNKKGNLNPDAKRYCICVKDIIMELIKKEIKP